MAKIKVLVVDDELPARQRIYDLLRANDQIEIVNMCANGYEAIDTIRGDKLDLVFLDVQMPEVSGFEVVSRIGPTKMPHVIFVTAYEKYALRAFESHALDYLLKPFDDERFCTALNRAVEAVRKDQGDALSRRLLSMLQEHDGESASPAEDSEKHRGLERLVIKSQGDLLFIRTDEIDYVEAAGVYVYLHVGPKSYLFRERMNNLEAQLDPESFFRIHRSTIVQLDRIKKLQHQANGEYFVILRSDKRLKLSRGRRDALTTRLGPT